MKRELGCLETDLQGYPDTFKLPPGCKPGATEKEKKEARRLDVAKHADFIKGALAAACSSIKEAPATAFPSTARACKCWQLHAYDTSLPMQAWVSAHDAEDCSLDARLL